MKSEPYKWKIDGSIIDFVPIHFTLVLIDNFVMSVKRSMKTADIYNK